MSFFSFNHTATTEIYTLSLHDALPIFAQRTAEPPCERHGKAHFRPVEELRGQIRLHRLLQQIFRLLAAQLEGGRRSEEHTSELQSHSDLVCRLLLEKKNQKKHDRHTTD